MKEKIEGKKRKFEKKGNDTLNERERERGGEPETMKVETLNKNKERERERDKKRQRPRLQPRVVLLKFILKLYLSRIFVSY